MAQPNDSQAAFLEGIIRSATDYAIISLDAQNRVVTWSAGAEVLLGWSADEILGQSGRLIFTPEDRARGIPEAEMADALTKGRAEDERWHIRKDGSRFWGSGVMVPMKGDAPPGFVKIMRDRTKEREAQRALRRSEALFRALVENIPQVVWRARRLGERTWGSPQWEVYTGLSLEGSAGMGWLDAIHPADRELTIEAWHEAEPRGELYVEHRIRRAASNEYRWFQTRARRIRLDDERPTEWLGTSTDVHELRRALERQTVLARELHHRTRNLLGIVQAIARQTLRRSSDLSDFDQRFGERLAALARVHSLVARPDADAIDLAQLVDAEIRAHAEEERFAIQGPSVRLNERAAETMALAIHELATNAVKHGALGGARGQLAVQWAVNAGVLVLEWEESGTQRSAEPSGRGYGRELIEVALPFALGARTRLDFTGDGIYCRIEVPDHEWKPSA